MRILRGAHMGQCRPIDAKGLTMNKKDALKLQAGTFIHVCFSNGPDDVMMVTGTKQDRDGDRDVWVEGMVAHPDKPWRAMGSVLSDQIVAVLGTIQFPELSGNPHSYSRGYLVSGERVTGRIKNLRQYIELLHTAAEKRFAKDKTFQNFVAERFDEYEREQPHLARTALIEHKDRGIRRTVDDMGQPFSFEKWKNSGRTRKQKHLLIK